MSLRKRMERAISKNLGARNFKSLEDMSRELKLAYEALGNGFANTCVRAKMVKNVKISVAVSLKNIANFPPYNEKSIQKYWLKRKNSLSISKKSTNKQ